MDIKDSRVKGGVSIVHQLHEGKHHYEVEDVVKFKKANGGGAFARKGDRLLQINGMDLQDLTPEEFAQMLSKGNSMLTVHQASRMKEHSDQTCPEESAFHPVSKKTTLLSFCLEMRREEDLGEDWSGEGEEGREGDGGEEDVCPDVDEEKEQEGDLLVVAFTNTSISVVRGRGCEAGSSCHDCGGTGCNLNEVVMVAESSTVTLVPRGMCNFIQEKQRTNISIEHAVSQMYLRTICAKHIAYMAPTPERITIYYYKQDCIEMPFRGIPVVLNFTDSNCFLKCNKDGEKVLLRVETCEKQKLKHISKSDEKTLSFVFYMKSARTHQCLFESALCPGWFIHVVNTNAVQVDTPGEQRDDPSFFFFIRK